MNKKAMEKVISVYWFAILIIVAGGVFAMVSNFYNHPVDVRELEANIMINKLADCLAKGGKINPDFLTHCEDFDIIDNCGLNFDNINKENAGEYYVEIKVDGCPLVFGGNKNWLASCEVQKDEEHAKLPKCVKRGFYALDGDAKKFIEILSAINKVKDNVK